MNAPEPESPPPQPHQNLQPRRRWLDRLQALFEVFLMSGIVSSFLAVQPFLLSPSARSPVMLSARTTAAYILLETTITLFLLWILLKAHGESLGDFGLRFRNWPRNLLIGLAAIPFLFLVNLLVAQIFRTFFPKYFTEVNPLTDLIRTPQDLAIFAVTVLIAGGFKEEVQRAFIIRRFQRHLGGAVLGLVIWSAVFAAGHYVQGVQGVAVAGILGLIFGTLYLARGNLIPPIVSHAAYDLIALLGYWFTRQLG